MCGRRRGTSKHVLIKHPSAVLSGRALRAPAHNHFLRVNAGLERPSAAIEIGAARCFGDTAGFTVMLDRAHRFVTHARNIENVVSSAAYRVVARYAPDHVPLNIDGDVVPLRGAIELIARERVSGQVG